MLRLGWVGAVAVGGGVQFGIRVVRAAALMAMLLKVLEVLEGERSTSYFLYLKVDPDSE